MAEQSTIAAVDLGSNSFHCQIARVDGEQTRGGNITYVDVNRVLPNGQPNPHFLQAYGDGNFFRGLRNYNYDNLRAAVAWRAR